MIIKELKFIGLLLFIIFAILLLVSLVSFVTYQRFQCSEYINHMKNIPISGKIDTIIPYLHTGDLLLTSYCLNKNINNINCFKRSRGNFVKNNYNFSHIGIIYRKKNIIYLIESINYNDPCSKIYSLTNKKYKNGLRIVKFNEYISHINENIRANKDCCTNYGIRFINRKINQEKLNRRLENEFNILSNKNFNNLNNLRIIATSGWFLKNMPNNFNYSTEIFYPHDEKDTFFCSEMTGVLLQRIGVMKRINRARMFYPADYNGSNDHNMFEKGMYSPIKIYE